MSHTNKVGNIFLDNDKPMQEKCGIVGIFSSKMNELLPLTLKAAGGVQHRGQQGAGAVLQTDEGFVKHAGAGLIREVFLPDVVSRLNKPCLWAIVHCRYGTNGGYQQDNLQPCVLTDANGRQIAVAHNGEFVISQKLKSSLSLKLQNNASDTIQFSHLLISDKNKSWEKKILNTLSQITGAFSLIIGINNALYAARDNFGIRPLIIGKKNKDIIVASETQALNKIGAKIIREVKPGEIIRIDKNGLKTIKAGSYQNGHFCDFEWAYFSRPDSQLSWAPGSWMTVSTFREKCGEILALENPIKNATFIMGIPDSGVYLATGYANALKKPYRQVIIRDHYDPNGSQRLFMRDDQKEKIGSKVLGKLSVITDAKIWKDAIVVIGDDSIVRGNVSGQITKTLFNLGAKEVHWIIGFPPVMRRCHLGVSMRTEDELIANRHDGDTKKIALEISATSVSYISHAGFLKARLGNSGVKIPKNYDEIFLNNGGCGGCVTGIYPVDREGKIYEKNSGINFK